MTTSQPTILCRCQAYRGNVWVIIGNTDSTWLLIGAAVHLLLGTANAALTKRCQATASKPLIYSGYYALHQLSLIVSASTTLHLHLLIRVAMHVLLGTANVAVIRGYQATAGKPLI